MLTSTSGFKRGQGALGSIITVLLSIVAVSFLVYFSSNVSDLSSQMRDDGLMEGEVGSTVDNYNQNSHNFWDWAFAALVMAIWIGSLWFISSRGERSLQWAFIMILLMILGMMAAGYTAETWNDTIGDNPSMVERFPITDFFFGNFMAVIGVMMFTQVLVGLYTNRGESGI